MAVDASQFFATTSSPARRSLPHLCRILGFRHPQSANPRVSLRACRTWLESAGEVEGVNEQRGDVWREAENAFTLWEVRSKCSDRLNPAPAPSESRLIEALPRPGHRKTGKQCRNRLRTKKSLLQQKSTRFSSAIASPRLRDPPAVFPASE